MKPRTFQAGLRLTLAALGALLLCGPGLAQPPNTALEAALMAPSPRLRLFALQTAHPEGAAAAVTELQFGQGMRQPKGQPPQFLTFSYGVLPTLRYDSNLNSGIPGDTIFLGGIPFSIAKDDQAKAGMLLGVAGYFAVDYALAPGATLAFTAHARAERSPAHDINLYSADLRACAAQFVGNASWFDLCFGSRYSEKPGSSVHERHVELGATKVFETAGGYHEASLTLGRLWRDDGDNTSLRFELDSARAGLGLVGLAVDVNAPNPGRHARQWGVRAALTRPVAGASTRIFAELAEEGGSQLFGTPRQDRLVILGLQRTFFDRVNTTLRLEQRQSSIAVYDGLTVGLDFSLTKFGF